MQQGGRSQGRAPGGIHVSITAYNEYILCGGDRVVKYNDKR